MSTSTRLLVLGVVRLFQPVHGYDVRRELASWHAEEWASVAPGSIYNALKTLTRDGLLEIVGTDQVGGRPERTTYRLTSRGEQELSELLRDTWWTVRMPVDPLAAGIALIPFMQRDEAIAALEARIAKVTGELAHLEHAIQAIDDIETPAYVRELMRLIGARLGAEIGWAKALLPRLRAGEYTLAGDAPWTPGAKPTTGKRGSAGAAAKATKAAKAAKTATAATKSKPKAKPAASAKSQSQSQAKPARRRGA